MRERRSMRTIFWTSAFVAGYVYVGYPALLGLWAALRGRRDREPRRTADDRLPGVTIVLVARNEAPLLSSRLDNLLSLDYPADRRQIVVVSDGSTDGTAATVAPYSRLGVELLAVSPRGKAAALAAGVARAVHPVLIFADARQAFAPDALRQLVEPLDDPSIGGVTGELLLDTESHAAAGRRGGGDRRARERREAGPDLNRRRGVERRGLIASTIADGIGLYWRYEKRLRRLESRIGSTLGATGAIYSLRRDLWTAPPPDTLVDDMLVPLRAVLAGSRMVFNERAIAYDRTAADARAESRRKIRTLAGNVQILWLEPRLLDPRANPVWFQYVSHKVGRLVVPYALVGLLVSSGALATDNRFFAAAFAAQAALYALAAYGGYLERTGAPAPLSGPAGVAHA